MGSDPLVNAFLDTRRAELASDASETIGEHARRLAQFTARGARSLVMEWGSQSPDHAALAALLSADHLEGLILGYGAYDRDKRHVVTFGPEERHEVFVIKKAMINVWRFLDKSRALQPLGQELGLIDANGFAVA